MEEVCGLAPAPRALMCGITPDTASGDGTKPSISRHLSSNALWFRKSTLCAKMSPTFHCGTRNCTVAWRTALVWLLVVRRFSRNSGPKRDRHVGSAQIHNKNQWLNRQGVY